MKKKHFGILICFVILLTIFTFKDLEISKHLVNDKSVFSLIFEVIGILPVYVGIILFGVTMFNLVKKDFMKILSILITFVGSLLLVLISSSYIIHFNGLIIFGLSILSIILCFMFLFFSKKINKEFYQKSIPFVCTYFATCCLATAVVFTIKTFVGRVRFEDLNSDFSNFTRWYVVNGITGNYSFPSGHVCSASTILCLNNLPKCFSFNKKQKIILYIFTSLHILITAFTRVVLGRHYASDVLMAFGIVYLVKEISTTMFFKHRQQINFGL